MAPTHLRTRTLSTPTRHPPSSKYVYIFFLTLFDSHTYIYLSLLIYWMKYRSLGHLMSPCSSTVVLETIAVSRHIRGIRPQRKPPKFNFQFSPPAYSSNLLRASKLSSSPVSSTLPRCPGPQMEYVRFPSDLRRHLMLALAHWYVIHFVGQHVYRRTLSVLVISFVLWPMTAHISRLLLKIGSEPGGN